LPVFAEVALATLMPRINYLILIKIDAGKFVAKLTNPAVTQFFCRMRLLIGTLAQQRDPRGGIRDLV